MSTKEDKIITFTLFLVQDNKLKLDAVNKLNKFRSTFEGLELDDNTELDLIQSIHSVSSSIKQSYKKQNLISKGLIRTALIQQKQNTIVWLDRLNYATTCCCRQHPMYLKTQGLKLSLDNIDCHCLLLAIYDFFSLASLKN